MVHALLSEANWKFASPVPDSSPIVVNPVLETLNKDVYVLAVDDDTENRVLCVSPLLACTVRRAKGVVVPIPSDLVDSLQKKLELFCEIVEPLENKTEPSVNDGKVNLLLKVVQSAADKSPLFNAEAVGRWKVWVVPLENMAKSVPEVEEANVCAEPVRAEEN